jgi:hypothetical protein
MAGTGPLAGFTVAVATDRRRDQLADLLAEQSARVVLAPVLRIIPTREDPQPGGLDSTAFVETVLRRGYRLALD